MANRGNGVRLGQGENVPGELPVVRAKVPASDIRFEGWVAAGTPSIETVLHSLSASTFNTVSVPLPVSEKGYYSGDTTDSCHSSPATVSTLRNSIPSSSSSSFTGSRTSSSSTSSVPDFKNQRPTFIAFPSRPTSRQPSHTPSTLTPGPRTAPFNFKTPSPPPPTLPSPIHPTHVALASLLQDYYYNMSQPAAQPTHDFRSMNSPLITLRDILPVTTPLLNTGQPDFRHWTLYYLTNVITLPQLIPALKSYKYNLETYGNAEVERLGTLMDTAALENFRGEMMAANITLNSVVGRVMVAECSELENEGVMVVMEVAAKFRRLDEFAVRKARDVRRRHGMIIM